MSEQATLRPYPPEGFVKKPKEDKKPVQKEKKTTDK